MRGNPGKRRLPNEPQPQIAKTCPEPPPFLVGHARDEWWSVGPQLHQMGLLTCVDLACFAAYCNSYGVWRQACEALARMADRDETMHGLLVKTVDGNARRNPRARFEKCQNRKSPPAPTSMALTVPGGGAVHQLSKCHHTGSVRNESGIPTPTISVSSGGSSS
jgi:P27 family predicted phage terminase small subunit